MMDYSRQVSRKFMGLDRDSKLVSERPLPTTVFLHRVRDTIDAATDYEIDFNIPEIVGNDYGVFLDIHFLSAIPAQNCAGSFCSSCEVFSGADMDDTTLILTHPFVSTSIRVFLNDIRISTWGTSGTNEIVLITKPAVTDSVKVCYLWMP